MVSFTPRIAGMVITFAFVVDALSTTPPTPEVVIDQRSPGVASEVKTSDNQHSNTGRSDVHMFSRRSDHSSAIIDNHNPSYLGTRSPLGPRRLDSSPESRRHHGKHGHHGHKKHHRDSNGNAQSTNATSSALGNSTAPAPVARRSVYVTKGQGNHRISINLVTHDVSSTDHARDLAARGLLDPIIPIVGLIPGLEGVVNLVPELLNGLLGPILGGLIISPNKPKSQALAATNDTLANESQYVLAATKSNASTIWLVDTGRSAPPDAESALTSNSSMTATTNERMVSLQMAFVDAKTGEFEAYCATYERDPAKPVSLGVVPCKDSNPHESQMFAYDPETSVLRAIWGSDSVSERTLGMRMRRQYMVGGGMNATVEGGESMVVMVFRAANTSAPAEAAAALGEGSAKSLERSSSAIGSDKTGNGTSSKDSISAEEYDEGEADDGLEDSNSEDDFDQEAETTTTVSGTPTATLSAASDMTTSDVGVASAEPTTDHAPVFVKHVGAK